MKKYLVMLLILIACIPSNMTTLAAQSNTLGGLVIENQFATEEGILSGIEKTIMKFYENKDLNYENDLSKDMGADIHSLIMDKANVHQHVTEIYGIHKENYKVTTELLENTRLGNRGFFKFLVKTTFNYVGTPHITSETCTEINITFDYDKNLITDFYDQYDYYDRSIRGQYSGLNELEENLQPFTMNHEITCRQEILKSNIAKVYLAEVQNPTETLADGSSVSMAAPLDYGKIVLYALNNCNQQSPVSGNGSVPYYDFAQIPGAWDCTNFVSHALLAGGAKVYDTGGSGISSTGWYYRSLSNRSSSWSSVNSLHSFLTTNTVPNTLGGSSNDYSTRLGIWGLGHVIQFLDPGDSIWWHSCIITDRILYEDRQYALCTGRTSASVYQRNVNAAEIYANGAKRTIFAYNN